MIWKKMVVFVIKPLMFPNLLTCVCVLMFDNVEIETVELTWWLARRTFRRGHCGNKWWLAPCDLRRGHCGNRWWLARRDFRKRPCGNISNMAAIRSAVTPGCLARCFLKTTGKQSRGSQLCLDIWKHVGPLYYFVSVASSVKKTLK